MNWKFWTTQKKNAEKVPEDQEKKEKRWNVKSCLSVLLCVTITVTTIHSNVLYAQAEAGENTDSVRFRFCPLSQTHYELGEKGSLQDTINQLPKTLKIIEEITEIETPDPNGEETENPDDLTMENNDLQDDDSSSDDDSPADNGEESSDPSPENSVQEGSEDNNASSGDESQKENDSRVPSSDDDSPADNGEEGGNPSSQDAPDVSVASSSETVLSPVFWNNASESVIHIVSTDNGSQKTDENAPETDNDQSTETSSPDTDDAPGTGTSSPGTDDTSNTESPTPGADDTSGAETSDPGADDSQDPGTSTPASSTSDNSDGTDASISDPAPEVPDDTEFLDSTVPENETPDGSGKEGTLNVITWECANYDDLCDSYTFTPVWDSKYIHMGNPEDIPEITVTFSEIPATYEVATQEELLKVLNALSGLPSDMTEIKIVLTNSIPLTQTLELSDDVLAGKNIRLESSPENGQHTCSLTRGSQTFRDPLLILGSSQKTRNGVAGGSLTLTNITIDGNLTAPPVSASSDSMSDAPAIISYGDLILDNAASIINNYNNGTPLYDESGNLVFDDNGNLRYAIPAYGGGLLAYEGSVTLLKGSSVSNNTAGRLGGGLYLDSNAVLHLYADVLTGNSVGANGIGEDLYAAAGSTIRYYDPSLNMNRNGFFIDPAANVILEGSLQDTTTPVEIFLNVCAGSGYSLSAVKEKLESAFGGRVKVLVPQIHTVTTDLRDWCVYDHYDTNCWVQTDQNNDLIPDSWENAYKDYTHRPYYSYINNWAASNGSGDILTWLENPIYDDVSGDLALVSFKEHIFSKVKENGRPEMIFVGYDVSPNVDFLFYNPKSDGRKIVEFDINSSKVSTHTLNGAGFLLDTGISGDSDLSGYLVYYQYDKNKRGTAPVSISLYKFEGIDIEELHNGTYIPGINVLITPKENNKGTYNITDWEDDMSIRITVDSGTVTVEQSPKNDTDNVTVYKWDNLDGTGYSGFGPLVAYNYHSCVRASSFTYSNLRMQYTSPGQAEADLLYPLMEADYSQDVPKKYFLNLLGGSGSKYDDTAVMGQYLPFLNLMQQEGIGLITDAEKTPFDNYLGPDGSQNLCQLKDLAGKSDPDALISALREYLSMYDTTEFPEDLTDKGYISAADGNPASVGNIWLADMNNKQIERILNRNTLPENYYIKVMDISCNMAPDKNDLKYVLFKPNGSELPLGSANGTDTDATASFPVPGTPGVGFIITQDTTEWPDGLYTVRQQVGDSELYGYSYFTLTRGTVEPQLPSVPTPETVHSSSSGHSGYTPEIRAAEPIAPGVVSTTVPSSGAAQPKTGDNLFPAMPVACGACTAFMLKIMLWMYEMDMGMATQRKEEVVQSLICWGKGSTRLRICITIFALAVVITAYHLLKAFCENSRQMMRAHLGL